MALSELQQATKFIGKASKILLLVPPKASNDSLAAMVSLYLTLEESRPESVNEVSPSHIPRSLQFLNGSSQVQTHLEHSPEIVVDISGAHKISGVRTENQGGGTRVHLALPSRSHVKLTDLATSIRNLPYDLIITLGLQDLGSLGQMYTDHTDFFFNTPVINIDNRGSNEHYGTVNLINITAGSVSEVAFELIKNISSNINGDVATAIYAGIVSGTDSFQSPTTTPHSFATASELLALGARREEVIENIVKTKPLSLLKLAGTIFSQIKYDEYGRLYWTILSDNDIANSQASSEDIPDALDEIVRNIADFNAAFIIHSQPQHQTTYLHLGPPLRTKKPEISHVLDSQSLNGILLSQHTHPRPEQSEQDTLEKLRSFIVV